MNQIRNPHSTEQDAFDETDRQSDQLLEDYWDALVDGDQRDQQRVASEVRQQVAASDLSQELALLDKLHLARQVLAADLPLSPHPPDSGTARLPQGLGLEDYEILEAVAQGGMGVVYKAWQHSLRRTVAVKMIRSGVLATDEEIHRFKSEAAAAAQLDHANIVSVHEIGQWEGQYFFTMDFVDGASLAQFVRDSPVSPGRAAECVRTVADAVHYAHQQGVLHRDLKPANILVDSSQRLRITDFGLAKQLPDPTTEASASLAEQQPLTMTGAIVGTPSYMSPEQARGEPATVGPQSDVYSLGAMLYELLTGRPPFRTEFALETLRQVMETTVAPPRVINAAVPQDLDTICLKCLSKEPRQRYQTARQLAEDLDRFLVGKPIQARPLGPLARIWRWCRRNPNVAGLVGLSALLLLMVTVGSSVSAVLISQAYRQARRDQTIAEKASERADRSAEDAVSQRNMTLATLNDLISRVQEKLSERAGTLTLRQEILADALTRLESIVEATGDQERDVYTVIARLRIGDLQWLTGHTDRASDSYQAARSLISTLLASDPDNIRFTSLLADALEKLGNLSQQAQNVQRAMDLYQETLELRQQILRVAPTGPESKLGLHRAELQLGKIHEVAGDLAKASVHYQRALATIQDVVDAHPDDAQAVQMLVAARYHTGRCQTNIGRTVAAEKSLGLALQLAESLLAADPANDLVRRDLMLSCGEVARYSLHRGELGEAQRLYERAVKAATRLAQAEPESGERQWDLWLQQIGLGSTYQALNDLASARRTWTAAVRILEPLATGDISSVKFQNDLFVTYTYLAELETRADRDDDALGWSRKAVGVLDDLAKRGLLVAPLLQSLHAYLKNSVRALELCARGESDLDSARQQTPEVAAQLLWLFARRLALDGHEERAAAVLLELRELQIADPLQRGTQHLALARGYSLCIKLLERLTRESHDTNKELDRRKLEYTESALASLETASQMVPAILSTVSYEHDLTSLREQPRYQELIQKESSTTPSH